VCLLTGGRRRAVPAAAPSKAVFADGGPPEVTPILAHDAALPAVELLHTAADSGRCGHPDMPLSVCPADVRSRR
jgi:hypothetical protein